METKVKKSSIATKMIVLTVFVTVLAALLASSFIISQDYQKEMRRVEESMMDVKKSLMPTLATALYTEDDDQIAQSLKGILNVEGVVEVRVRLADEEEDSHNLIKKSLEKMKEEERRSLGPTKQIKIIHIEEDAEEGEQEIVGDLFLYSTLQLAKNKVKNQVFKFSVVQVSQVLVLALSIFLIFRVFWWQSILREWRNMLKGLI